MNESTLAGATLPSHEVRGTICGRARACNRAAVVAIETGERQREPLVVIYVEFQHRQTRELVTRSTLTMRPAEARQLSHLLAQAADVCDETVTPGTRGTPRGRVAP
jgi:hypothetical protein